MIHRDSLSKTAVNLGISHLRARNYLDDTLIDVSSTRITERQLGFNHGRRIGNAFVNLDAGWQQGIGALDAQGAGDPRGNEPVARYNKYTLTLSYLQPFQLWGEQFSFDSLATGQRSEDALYSGQRISVGGLTSVRGFRNRPSPATAAATGATSCAGAARLPGHHYSPGCVSTAWPSPMTPG